MDAPPEDVFGYIVAITVFGGTPQNERDGLIVHKEQQVLVAEVLFKGQEDIPNTNQLSKCGALFHLPRGEEPPCFYELAPIIQDPSPRKVRGIGV